MSLLIIFQVALNLGFIAVATLFFTDRVRSRSGDDPRMTRGLQILSSKIAILQDLLDRSETIARQLTQLIDRKNQDVQERMEDVEIHLQQVQTAIEKSKEVAQIFQDKIPHQEIIERQNTAKYIQAAKMANQGMTVDAISKQLSIPRGELELIVKLNKDRMVVEKMPAWIEDDKPQRVVTESQPNQGQESNAKSETSDEGYGYGGDEPVTNEEAKLSSTQIQDLNKIVDESVRQSAMSFQLDHTMAEDAQRAVTAAAAAVDDKVRPFTFRRINATDVLR